MTEFVPGTVIQMLGDSTLFRCKITSGKWVIITGYSPLLTIDRTGNQDAFYRTVEPHRVRVVPEILDALEELI